MEPTDTRTDPSPQPKRTPAAGRAGKQGARTGSSAITRLRRKLILVAMLALLVTLLLLLGALLGTVVYQNTQRADNIISILYQNDGKFPEPKGKPRSALDSGFKITAETPYETRYTMATVSADGQIVRIEDRHLASMDDEQLEEFIMRAYDAADSAGYLDYYRFGTFANDDGSTTVIILDCFLRQQVTFNIAGIGAVAALVCLVMVFLLLIPLSKRAVRPFERNLARQQRFVTDASHELKTPLAIISANNELTEQLSGETQWTRSTKTQIARLNTLIRDLIDVTRASEAQDAATLPPLDLSVLASRTAEDFRPLADVAGKTLDARIEPDVWVKGNPESLERLMGLLLDNAVKHADEKGRIALSLDAQRRTATLRVANPAAALSADDLEHVFDRFYRADRSRARAKGSTGGYGIGLSVAQGLAERHGGKLTAAKEGDDVVFTVTLPRCTAPSGQAHAASSRG